MIADDLYNDLKAIKGERSFSELIRGAVFKKKKKTLGNLIEKHAGALKGDKEYDKVLKDVRKEWRKWTEKYA